MLDRRKQELARLDHLVKPVHARRRLLGHAFDALCDVRPTLSVLGQRARQQAEHDRELLRLGPLRVGNGPGHHQEHGHLTWRNLADASSADNIAFIADQIATDAIWLTIDKDVLPESEALTNWDQGQMPLLALLDLITGIGARKRIVGADICGEFSLPALRNPLKRIESRLDRPQRSADAARLARNEAVNRELLGTIWRAAA